MKAHCVRVIGPLKTSRPHESSAWISVGSDYLVLGVYGRSSSIKLRIIGDDGRTPVLQDAEQFELISRTIPNNWTFRLLDKNEWEITPIAWSSDGFWVSYFNGDAEAKALFRDQVIAMEEA